MAHITYHVVEHDGGWAYKLGDVFSESFPTHDQALKAAQRAAQEQQVGGETTTIRYQDASGNWRDEESDGGDRPEADVEDDTTGR